MTPLQIEFTLDQPNATEALGAALAHAYTQAGRGAAVVFLHGELGAGKTTCVRALLRTLGVTGLIRSPTYTLVEVYELPDLACIHVDLYRLRGLRDVEELGLRDYLSGNSLLLVEWPLQGAGALPTPDLEISLSYLDGGRQATLRAGSDGGHRLINVLRDDTSLMAYVSNLT
jgi:tRNA threonylcarbamoyladenosine biosynthesis protein TsaE